jgi:flagellar basal-body rod protein FlgC
MDFDSAMKISGSGLTAHRTWLNVLSSNLANMNTTKASDGKPYQRRTLIYDTAPVNESFGSMLDNALDEELEKVQVTDIVPDGRDFQQVYDPNHPDADENGIVLMPNISPVEEMANLLNATRSYDANLAALNTAKQLALKTLDIGK